MLVTSLGLIDSERVLPRIDDPGMQCVPGVAKAGGWA